MGTDHHASLRAIAARAVAVIDRRVGQTARHPDIEALRAFDPALAAQPASDLYLRFRDLEHACGAQDPALGRYLRRLGQRIDEGLSR